MASTGSNDLDRLIEEALRSPEGAAPAGLVRPLEGSLRALAQVRVRQRALRRRLVVCAAMVVTTLGLLLAVAAGVRNALVVRAPAWNALRELAVVPDLTPAQLVAGAAVLAGLSMAGGALVATMRRGAPRRG
jgi:hypothetical protein